MTIHLDLKTQIDLSLHLFDNQFYQNKIHYTFEY